MQRFETFIKCHINAFKYFGGIPEYIKIDNLKATISEATFYSPKYQKIYLEFSKFYNFRPVPCRVRQPQEKGKVESGIKYVKNNFFLGEKFENIVEAKSKLKFWLKSVCNVRIDHHSPGKRRMVLCRRESMFRP